MPPLAPVGFLGTRGLQPQLANRRATRLPLAVDFLENLPQLFCNSSGQETGYRVPNLLGYLNLGPHEHEIVWERLKTRRFAVCEWSIRLRMQITALLWLKEFCPDRERREVPDQTAEDVCAARLLSLPAARC